MMLLFLSLIIFFLSLSTSAQELNGEYFSNIQIGPMVGHTTGSTAKIWAYHRSNNARTMELMYQKEDGSGPVRPLSMPPRSQHHKSAQVTVTGLESNTTYNYEIRVSGNAVAAGSFKTAPQQYAPVKFNYLLTSCMDNSPKKGFPVQPVWSLASRLGNPSFGLLNGDTVYMRDGEYTINGRRGINYEKVWKAYERIRKVPHLDKFIGTTPSYGSWDDHDFGENDSKGDQPGKDQSLRIWKDMWPNPYFGTTRVKGNFYDFYWGDVHFIVLDNRWYRKGGSDQFGSGQLDWLEDKLKGSRGVFKIIVTGTNVLHQTGDIVKIGAMVRDHRISGVTFNTGDIHRNDFKIKTRDNWPYPATQFTSSGIGRHRRRPFAIMKVDTTIADPTITAHFYTANSNSLDANWINKATTCISVPDDNRQLGTCTQTIRLSELTAGGSVRPPVRPPPVRPSPVPQPVTPIRIPVRVPGPKPGAGKCGFSGSNQKYIHPCINECRQSCNTKAGPSRRKCRNCENGISNAFVDETVTEGQHTTTNRFVLLQRESSISNSDVSIAILVIASLCVALLLVLLIAMIKKN